MEELSSQRGREKNKRKKERLMGSLNRAEYYRRLMIIIEKTKNKIIILFNNKLTQCHDINKRLKTIWSFSLFILELATALANYGWRQEILIKEILCK